MSLPLWSAASGSCLLQSWCTIYSNCRKIVSTFLTLLLLGILFQQIVQILIIPTFKLAVEFDNFLFLLSQEKWHSQLDVIHLKVLLHMLCYFRIRVNLNLWNYRSLTSIGKEIYVSTASAWISFIKKYIILLVSGSISGNRITTFLWMWVFLSHCIASKHCHLCFLISSLVWLM